MNRADAAVCKRLLHEATTVLQSAISEFEAVAELHNLRRAHYLLARVFHQLGFVADRDMHALRFRKLSDFVNGQMDGGACKIQWADLQLPRSTPMTTFME